MQSLQQIATQSLPMAAESYGKMGWPIFPLLPFQKTPRTPDGFKSATADLETITQWWTNEPECNIGLHCRNLLVLDVDGNKGRASLAKLEAIYGKLPPTMHQKTPRGEGGTHLIFSTPRGLSIPNSAGKIGWDGRKEKSGLDVRSQDGYIVLAPSIHPDTRTAYEIDAANEIAECPEWLLNLALATKDKPAPKAVTADSSGDVDESDLIPEGGRNDAMISEAGGVARTYRKDPDLVLNIMKRRNDTRCDPPLPDDEIEKIVIKAIKYAAQDEVVPVFRIKLDTPQPITHPAATVMRPDDEQKLTIPPGARLLTIDEIKERLNRDEPACGSTEADCDSTSEVEALSESTELALRNVRDMWAEWGLRTVQYGEEGKVYLRPNLYNAVGLLTKDPDWCNSVYWNQFALDLAFSRAVPRVKAKSGDKVDDTTFTLLTYELQADSEAEFSKTTVIDALVCAGQQRAIHPVQEYLNEIKWDKTERIDRWLTDLLGAPDKPLVHAFAARWLIAAVARIFRPGCKMDTALILEGVEGIRKSSTFEELCPDPAWFSDDVGDFTKVDTVLCLRGKWIVEMGELTSLARHEVETAKAFIARKTDVYRAPYGRVAKDWPRQFVLCGSTNRSSGYLLEAEGHRRFWPTTVTGVKPGVIAKIRDQLWSEAVARFRAGEKWWLDEPELVEQARENVELRVVEHPWVDIIAARAAQEKIGDEVTMDHILTFWLLKDADKLTENDATKVGRIMSKLGWEKDRKWHPDGKTRYALYRKVG